MENPLRLKTMNHISIVCRSLEMSLRFYQNVLGFLQIKRPSSFGFNGAWLFNYGFGIHLLQSEDPENMSQMHAINPKDNHISFQCESMGNVEDKLTAMKMEYVKSRVEEGGIKVDQIFFHDPDGMMIEICNCDVLPIIPIGVGEASAVRSFSLSECNINDQEEPNTGSTKAIWDLLEDKYSIDDNGKKKYVCGKFMRLKLVGDKQIMNQVHEYENLSEDDKRQRRIEVKTKTSYIEDSRKS
ncbi:uncharacterized protein [Phyllobates terribilis]|uniref:uncharacterized protein n=1 Tax=Phyllobates terribilis TaxID=111132 RepID=UPI003CCB39F1